MSPPQTERFGPGAGLGVGADYPLAPWIDAGIEASAFGFGASATAPAPNGFAAPGTGTLFGLAVGLRVRPFEGPLRAPARLRPLWLEAQLGWNLTGRLSRAGFDVSVGYGIEIDGRWSVGPYVGYRQVIQPDDATDPADAQFLVAGVSARLATRPTRRPPPVEPTTLDPDVDRDGVLGERDLCPDAPEDRDGFADEDGCPDSDVREPGTLADADTGCRPFGGEMPEDASDLEGCEGAPLVRVVDREIVVSESIQFIRSSPRISRRSFPALERVARLILEHPEWRRIRIEGHADDRGSELRNLILSQERANRVRAFLVGRGLTPRRLEATGFGRARRIGAARSANRRVSLYIEDLTEPIRVRTNPGAPRTIDATVTPSVSPPSDLAETVLAPVR